MRMSRDAQKYLGPWEGRREGSGHSFCSAEWTENEERAITVARDLVDRFAADLASVQMNQYLQSPVQVEVFVEKLYESAEIARIHDHPRDGQQTPEPSGEV